MSENTGSRPTSEFARLSFRLGVVALLLLALTAGLVAARLANSRLQVLTQGDRRVFSLGVIFCEGLAAVAALAAFILGILGLGEVRQGAGKVEGRWLAIKGLGISTLTVLTLVVVHGVVMPALARKANKLESANKLKLLGLAMHCYHEDHGRFPPAVLRDLRLGDRAQPYSWRVALLPYLGKRELYSQYRRDQPWDSPANKAVLARMPPVFALPGSVRAADGLTHYQLIVGPGTTFERPDSRVKLWALPRGAAETILLVEAAVPVPWTKPEDLSYTADGPLPKVGGLVGNGFHALFADGDVRWIEAEEQENALRTLVPLNGR